MVSDVKRRINVQDKIAVVTGSTKGIGRAIGIKLLEEGNKVIFNYAKDINQANELKKFLIERGFSKFYIVQAELSTEDGLQKFVEQILNITNRIDYLVLNAGVTNRSKMDSIDISSWQKIMDTNLNIPFFIVQKLASYITNKEGRIIFIGSILGNYPHSLSIPYGVSKAGVHMLSQYLVKEFEARQITVNTIIPGFIDTPWQKDKEIDHRKRIESKIAKGRFGLPEEVANLCFHIIQNEYINGANIPIDGGYCYK